MLLLGVSKVHHIIVSYKEIKLKWEHIYHNLIPNLHLNTSEHNNMDMNSDRNTCFYMKNSFEY